MWSVSGQHMGACPKGLHASTTIVTQERGRGRGRGRDGEEEECAQVEGTVSSGTSRQSYCLSLPGNKLIVMDMDSPKVPRSLFPPPC